MKTAREIQMPSVFQFIVPLVFLFPLGLMFIGMSVWTIWEDNRMAHDGVATNATDVTQREDDVQQNHVTEERYYLTFKYTAGNVQYSPREMQVCEDTYNLVMNRKPLPLLYDRDHPDRVRVNLPAEIGDAEANVWTGGVIAAILLVPTFWWWIGGVLTRKYYRRLQRDGVPVPATVGSTGSSKYGLLILGLQYADSHGAPYVGSCETLVRAKDSNWKPGDTLTIKYDPSRPDRFIADPRPGRKETPGAGESPR